MIVDTSDLVAITFAEPGSNALLAAVGGGGLVPAPVLVEFHRVLSKQGSQPIDRADSVLRELLTRLSVEPFTAEDADLAAGANAAHGTGDGHGGTLNLLDLMVYGMARRTGRPILCTGRDFAATGIPIHPASRVD